jgi:non-heme Fe2+,alpha-ketoglutarate-dependent halogenase
VITQNDTEKFWRLGYLSPTRVMTTEEAVDVRGHLESHEREHGGALPASQRFKSHLLFKWLADLIRRPVILDLVESLIGPDLLVWGTDWWIKEARSPDYVSWHQDSRYWGLDTTKLVTIWVALSPSTLDSGCLRVLPGSHSSPPLPHIETFAEDNMLTRGQTIEGIDETEAHPLQLQPGEASVFAFGIAHASGPNQSEDRRIGVAIRYLPPDARQTRSVIDTVSLVRGVDDHGHFLHEPEPDCDLDPAAVEFHRRALAAREEVIYEGVDPTPS